MIKIIQKPCLINNDLINAINQAKKIIMLCENKNNRNIFINEYCSVNNYFKK